MFRKALEMCSLNAFLQSIFVGIISYSFIKTAAGVYLKMKAVEMCVNAILGIVALLEFLTNFKTAGGENFRNECLRNV